MLYIVTFLYGAIGGAISCLVFFVLVFNKIESLMMNVIKKKALKHAAYIAVAKEAAEVPPAKVETLCKLVNFDHDVVGTVIQCRAVMYSNTIKIYAVDRLETLPDHRQIVQAEHLLGKINRSCVEVSAKKLSKYHRHINTDSLTASVKGKCTILTAKEGISLFLPDAETLLQMRLDRIREEQEARGARHHIRHQSAAATASPSAEEEPQPSCEYPMHRLDDPKPLAVSKDGVMYNFDTVRSDPAVEGEGPLALHNPSAGKADPTPLDISTWRAIAIKFPTRRENERWLNLLQSNARTELFQEYLTHMPQRDVFNLLITRLFFENTSSNRLHDILTEKIQHKFEATSRSLGHNVKGNIYLDGLTIGGEVPLISSVSEGTISSSGDFEFGFDILYRGGLVLLIRFAITYREIKVPDIVFTIRVLELAGRMRMNIGPPPTRKFWLGCPKPPELRLDISQEVSKEGLLGNLISLLPDLGEIISNVVREKIFEDMILPKYDDFPWPSFDESKEEDSSNFDDAEGSEELASMSASSRQAGTMDSRKSDKKSDKGKSDKEKEKEKEKKKKKKHHFFGSKKSKDGEGSSSSADDYDDGFSEGQSFQSAPRSSAANKKKGADKASATSAASAKHSAAASTPGGKKSANAGTGTGTTPAAPTGATSPTAITEKKQDLIKDYLDGVLHDTVSPTLTRSEKEEGKRFDGAKGREPTYRSSGGAAVLARSPGEVTQPSPVSAQARGGSINLSLQSSVSGDTFISYGAAAVTKAEQRDTKNKPEKK